MAFVRVKDGYRYLVESSRVGGKVRQRTLKYLGKADPGRDDRQAGSTAEKLARQSGVSARTIYRSAEYERAVEVVKATVDPEIEAEIASGQAPARWRIVMAARVIEAARIEAEAASGSAPPGRSGRP